MLLFNHKKSNKLHSKFFIHNYFLKKKCKFLIDETALQDETCTK